MSATFGLKIFFELLSKGWVEEEPRMECEKMYILGVIARLNMKTWF